MSEVLHYAAAAPFEAARHVDILPESHRSRRLHGHSFLARVCAALPAGWAPFPGAEVQTLADSLAACVAQLDYQLLNDHMKVPTDENLARWVRESLDAPNIEIAGIQSTRDQGADIDGNNHLHVWRRFRFEAAHQLPNVPEGHKCGRMHGHGFEVILHANQDLGKQDMGVDFAYLDACWAPLHAKLNYGCLNDLPGLENPTSEMLAAWIWRRLRPELQELSWVTIYETDTAGCHHDGTQHCIWIEQRVEGALRLIQAPEGDPRGHLHGHSYLVRLHVSAPLDEVMGWTIDYGDVKEMFKPVYEQLDHHRLNDVAGIENTDSGTVARWIRRQVREVLPQLDRVDVYETSGCGAISSSGEQGPALPA